MDTKNNLLKLVLDAQSNCVYELFFLIHEAVQRCEIGDIDWYLMNDMSESDVLLFILLNDVELSVHFNEITLLESVHYLFRVPKTS